MDIKKISAEETLDIRHRVLWPNEPLDFCKLENDPIGLHYGLFVNDKLVSVASIFITDNSARLRKFATLKEHQGKGLGTELLSFIINELTSSNKVNLFWCDARVSACDFYKRFGMHQKGDVFYKSHVEYIVMEKVLKH